MASFRRPLDPTDPTALVAVNRRTTPDLPSHVLGHVVWQTQGYDPGYYLWITHRRQYTPVEFLDHSWFFLVASDEFYFTSSEDRIPFLEENTGYWFTTGPQHPEYEASEEGQASSSALTLDITNVPGPLTRDPAISPFVTAHSSSSSDQGGSSSSESASPGDQEDQSRTVAPTHAPGTPLEFQQEADVLAGVLEHVLDIEDREPEDSNHPEELAYLHLVQLAYQEGLRIPSPPPLTQPGTPVTPASPVQAPVYFPQPVPPAQPPPNPPAMAAAPAAQAPVTGKLAGEKPDIFTGDRTKADTFLHQFNLYRGMNETHETMTSPYFRTMCALSRIKGPLVQTWVNSQVEALREKTSRQLNPIGQDENVLWTDFTMAFETAFTDTTKVQQAYNKLMHLKMYKDDLDLYVATFKELASQAGFAEDAGLTIHQFAYGLKPALLDEVLRNNPILTTMDQWTAAARQEQQKKVYHNSFRTKGYYQWMTPRYSHQGNGESRRHPNDRTVPMDVDQPVFTQVRRAFTEEDKQRFKAEGRCFRCDKQGHMARECPERKQQAFVPQKSKTTFWKKQFGNHLPKRKFGNHPSPLAYQRRQSFRSNYIRPQACVASIQEVDESPDEEDQEEYEEDQDVPSIATRTAKFTEKERELWLQEMRNKGINF